MKSFFQATDFPRTGKGPGKKDVSDTAQSWLFLERSDVIESLKSRRPLDFRRSIMMRRARESIFWPGMLHEVKQLAETCEVCQQFKPRNQKDTLKPVEDGESPWDKVATDLRWSWQHDHYNSLTRDHQTQGTLPQIRDTAKTRIWQRPTVQLGQIQAFHKALGHWTHHVSTRPSPSKWQSRGRCKDHQGYDGKIPERRNWPLMHVKWWNGRIALESLQWQGNTRRNKVWKFQLYYFSKIRVSRWNVIPYKSF